MKKILTKQEHDAVINKVIEQKRHLKVPFGLQQTKKITGPTVAVMEWKDVKTFNQPGLKIAYAIHLDSKKYLTEKLKRLLKLNERGLLAQYSLLDNPKKGRYTVSRKPTLRDMKRHRGILGFNPNLMRIRGGRVCQFPGIHGRISDFDVEKEFDDDGTPVIVVIRSDDEPEVPEYKMKHVRRSEWKKKKDQNTPNDGGNDDKPTNVFLKAPLCDQMLIEAMKKVDRELTAGKHASYQKWKDDNGFHEKEFNNCSLLVCLFFYVFLQELYADVSFYRNRKAFLDYCEGKLGKGFNMKTYRSFFKKIAKLQVRKDSFDKYMKGKVQPDPHQYTGLANLYFWRELYLRAARCFNEIFIRAASE